MALIRDDAVVLARVDYSETSQVIVLFTRQRGKVRTIARGIKRGTRNRFAVGIDLLEVGTVVFSVRHERADSLAAMTEWKQTHAYSGLRESLDRLYAAQYAGEITANLTEDWDPHEDLFCGLTDSFAALSTGADPIPETVRFQRRLLNAIGLSPRFDACVTCGRSSDLTHFSSFEGGMICRHCEPGQIEKWQVARATLALLFSMGQLRAGSDSPPTPNHRTSPPDPPPPPPSILASAAQSTTEAIARSWTAAFSVLNYHIAHLMGREPLLAAKLVPAVRRRRT
jgi:DNA repair protein RecO (recombination protein O)